MMGSKKRMDLRFISKYNPEDKLNSMDKASSFIIINKSLANYSLW